MPTGFYKRKSAPIRFIEKIKQGPDCWIWTGAVHTTGYGRFGVKYKTVQAHRYSYELFYHKIYFKDLDVCHKCDNRLCVRPDHLFLGTRTENMQDCKAKGRNTIGEKHPHSKLTNNDVLEIRKMKASGKNYKYIAHKFKITENNVYYITTRRTWNHI